MKKFVKEINLEKFKSKALDLYFKDESFAVFDIETTGLSPKYSKMILSGILLYKEDSFQAIQFFAEDLKDEPKIIEETIKILSSVNYIITYNGRHFDMPFLLSRATHHNISSSKLPFNLDLYQVVSTSSDLKSIIGSLSQKSIENYMGLSSSRKDEISGGESVSFYNTYLLSKDENIERKILLHNYDDIIQLYKILPIIKSCDFHMAMFKSGYVAGSYLIESIKIKRCELLVTGKQLSSPKDYISFPTEDKPYSLRMDSLSSEFNLSIPFEKVASASYIDVLKFLDKEDLNIIKRYPSYESGYLIIVNKKQINYLELNSFLLLFLRSQLL